MQGSRQNVSGNVKLPSCEKPLSFALHAEDEMDFVNGKRASLSNPFFLFSSFPLGTDNNTYFVIQQDRNDLQYKNMYIKNYLQNDSKIGLINSCFLYAKLVFMQVQKDVSQLNSIFLRTYFTTLHGVFSHS